jgi:hypothetical protein
MMGAYEWVLDGVIALCLFFIVGNWGCFVSWYYARTRNRIKSSFSFAPPYLSGLVASAAMLFHPRAGLRLFFWLPLALDPSIGFASVIWLCGARKR